MERWLQIRFGVSGLLLCLVVLVWAPSGVVSGAQSDYLRVRFLDVGQGDAIHIVTPDGYEALIDGGATAAVLRALADGRPLSDRTIDVVIATHPDTDHIGGLVDIFERYQVSLIFETTNINATPAASAFDGAVSIEGAQVVTAKAGQEILLGASTTLRILSPLGDATNWGSNNSSIVVQVSYGDIDFLLTGDAPSAIESYLVTTYGSLLQSEVLKLGHHGSKTSSSKDFLQVVQSDYSVVSAGKENRYGHPHAEVLERARAQGSEVVSTAEMGTIEFQTDGRRVWLVE